MLTIPERHGPRKGASRAVARALFVLLLPLGCARKPTFEPLDAPFSEPVPLEIISWPSGATGGAFDEGRRGLARALELYAEGDREKGDALVVSSLYSLERAGALSPELGSWHFQTVLSAMAGKLLVEAEKRALRGLEKFPDDFDHHLALGQVRYQFRRWPQAAESLRRAARLRPRSLKAWHWLAEICFQMGAQEEGIGAQKRALELIGFPRRDLLDDFWSRPGAKDVLGNALKVFHRFGDFDSLLAVAHEYRLKFPEVIEAAMAEGVALSQLGRHAEAEPLLRAALSAPENAEEVGFALGISLSKQGKWAEAASTLAALLSEHPYFSRAYYQLGLAWSRLGREAQAEAMFEKSRALAQSERELRRSTEQKGAGDPGRGAASRSLACLLRGQFDEAEAALRAADLRDNPHAVFALAGFYLDCLRTADAEKVLAHAAQLVGPAHPDIAGYQAVAMFLRGEEEKAIAALRALPQAESTSAWKLKLGKLLLERGQAVEAALVLEPLHQGRGDHEASFLFAQALLERGEAQRALEALRGIGTGDLRWIPWQGDVWLARALSENRQASGEDLKEAARALEAVPAAARASRAYLLARAKLSEREGKDAVDVRKALERYDAVEPAVKTARRQIASAVWPQSAPLYHSLARLHASRGQIKEAVRWARLSLQAAPRSPDVLRDLGAWLTDEGEVFYRLRALRDLAKLVPGDATVKEEIQKIQAAWFSLAGN